MSDHNFEKEVRQKLVDLKLTPSASAWVNIEDGMRKQKRPRSFLWLPLLLLIGAGGFFIWQFSNGPETGEANKVISVDLQPKRENIVLNEEVLAEPNKGVELNKPGDIKTDRTALKGNIKVEDDKPGIGERSPIQATQGQSDNRARDLARVPGNVAAAIKDEESDKSNSSTRQETTADRNISLNNTFGKKPSSDISSPIKKEIITDTINADKHLEQDGNKNTDGNVSSPAVPVKKRQTGKKWSFGVNVYAGGATINDGNFPNLDKSLVEDVSYTPNFSAAAPQAPPPVAPQTPPPAQHQPSTISPGGSYAVGAVVKRQLSERLFLSAGINYLQLNTRFSVGERRYGNQVVNNGLRGFLSVASYYTVEPDQSTEYKNRYHFIDIPIQLHTKLNRSQRLPIYWNAGIAVSQLLKSNSLHFDGTTGVYYHDDNLLNRTNAAVSTGFSFSILNKTMMPVWIGPNARYNISEVLQKDISKGKHFISLGVDMKVFLK